MKNKILMLGVTGLFLGGLMLRPTVADAYQGNPNIQGPYYSEERHEQMEKAFENKDYNAWKNLMQGRGRVTTIINSNNFAKFAQAHLLAEQGKLDEANKIRQELGLNQGSHMGQNWK